MSVTVKIPTQLRAVVGGAPAVAGTGGTVREVLASVYEQHEELRERIADGASGELRRFVNVYLDEEDIRFLDGLDTAVPEGGSLTILPAVAGG